MEHFKLDEKLERINYIVHTSDRYHELRQITSEHICISVKHTNKLSISIKFPASIPLGHV